MNLYGASGHCKVIIDMLKAVDMHIECVFDDNVKLKKILQIPVKQWIGLDQLTNKELIISIGNNIIRKKLAESIDANYISVVHPSAIVSKSVSIGAGTVIMPKVVINASAKIGKHNIINTSAVVEHDCDLKDFVHISPNSSLAGNVTVGEGTHIGLGACVIQGIKIGKWATIGAGAVVIKDVPDGAVVVGNPGRIINS